MKTLFSIKLSEANRIVPGFMSNQHFYIEWETEFDGRELIKNSVGPISREVACMIAQEIVQAEINTK